MSENIIRIGIFKRPEELTVDTFRDYWHYHHAAIASNMVGMQNYDQNHVIRPTDLGIAPVNDRECAGMSKIWFGSLENEQGNDAETMGKLAIDEKYLFHEMDLVTCEETLYLKRPDEKPFVKYMCLLKRKPELSEDEFRAKLAQAADAVKVVPGITGYIENDVLSRTYNDIQGEKRYFNIEYDRVPVDAVVEFYFEFKERYILGDAFDSEEGAVVKAAFQDICENAACYLCNVYHIV